MTHTEALMDRLQDLEYSSALAPERATRFLICMLDLCEPPDAVRKAVEVARRYWIDQEVSCDALGAARVEVWRWIKSNEHEGYGVERKDQLGRIAIALLSPDSFDENEMVDTLTFCIQLAARIVDNGEGLTNCFQQSFEHTIDAEKS